VRSALAAALLAVVLPRAANAAPITFQAPSPLDDGQLAVGSQATWVTAPDGPPPEHAHERSLSIAAVAMAAILPRLTAAVAVPFVERRVTAIGPTGEAIERRARGAGDLTASLAFIAVHRPVAGGRLLLAPFATLKTPTGSSATADELGPLPQRLQVGTGAWDTAGGLLASWQADALELDAALSYLLRSEAHEFDAGDEVRGEMSVRRALIGERDRLLGVFESRVVWQAPDTGPLAPATSGGASWVVCPGLQATVGSHTIEAAAEVPLRQPADQHVAIAARVGYRITLGR
jgi:hypothetical protein